jgi:hypothetical protein
MADNEQLITTLSIGLNKLDAQVKEANAAFAKIDPSVMDEKTEKSVNKVLKSLSSMSKAIGKAIKEDTMGGFDKDVAQTVQSVISKITSELKKTTVKGLLTADSFIDASELSKVTEKFIDSLRTKPKQEIIRIGKDIETAITTGGQAGALQLREILKSTAKAIQQDTTLSDATIGSEYNDAAARAAIHALRNRIAQEGAAALFDDAIGAEYKQALENAQREAVGQFDGSKIGEEVKQEVQDGLKQAGAQGAQQVAGTLKDATADAIAEGGKAGTKEFLPTIDTMISNLQKRMETYNFDKKTGETNLSGIVETGTNEVGNLVMQWKDANDMVRQYTVTTQDSTAAIKLVETAYRRLTTLTRERGKLERSNITEQSKGTEAAQETIDANNKRLEAVKLEESALQEIVSQYADITTVSQQSYNIEKQRQESLKNASTARQSEKSISTDINNLYVRQRAIISEIYTLERANVSAGENQKAVNNERLAILQQELSANDKIINSTDIVYRNTEKESRLVDAIAKGKASVVREEQKSVDVYNKQLQAMGQVERTLVSMATFVSTRFLRNMFEEAIEYASTFYDSMNEIRIVTMGTEAEANKLGETYRKMAQEMSVSSKDIASAAVEFWRQGLDETQVNERLVETTKYAKISGLEFNDAAEIITSAMNTMNISAQKVGDVFAYLGDMSAAG